MDVFTQRFVDISLLRGDFTLRSGRKSKFYLDIRKSYGDPELLNGLADRLWDAFNCETDCVVGYGFGGIPLATTISSRHNLRLVNIREDRKDHGTGQQIEGYQPKPGDRVIIPDDVFSTGSSIKRATEIIRQTGAEIVKYGVVVDREEGDPSSLEAPLVHVFTKRDLGIDE